MPRPELNPHLTPNERMLLGVAEYLWIVLANVSQGNWEKQSTDWQEAAAKARDDYYNALRQLNARAA
jgi:thiosulfate reductase cytochrome b subunit